LALQQCIMLDDRALLLF